ncbi:hypothetical protein TALC_00888 [Thermoplasmatales archaeon BRNA1]|nr:hypothetical protein TALC_00888 [Thermoplasmatales archaeon BRNA1]
MRRICGECGNEIEDGADFCYFCGATIKSAYSVDDSGAIHNLSENPDSNLCPRCGAENAKENKFCDQCGAPMDVTRYVTVRPHKLSNTEKLALILAILPGALNLFGLGHIVLRKWSRAMMYLCMSAIIIYVRWFTPGLSTSMVIGIEILGFIIYFRQCIDVFRLIYFRPVDQQRPPNSGNDGEGGI